MAKMTINLMESVLFAGGLENAPHVMEPAKKGINDAEVVIELLQDHRQQLAVTNDIERQVLTVLWNLRGTVKIDNMLNWTGWSKQTLYNKWKKYGMKVDDEENS